MSGKGFAYPWEGVPGGGGGRWQTDPPRMLENPGPRVVLTHEGVRHKCRMSTPRGAGGGGGRQGWI